MKAPPIYIVLPDMARLVTFPSASGFHAVSAPVAVTNAASLFLCVPGEGPAEVKVPPTYMLAPLITIA